MLLTQLDTMFGANLVLSLLVFLSTGLAAFGVMATARVRRGIRRRAAGVAADTAPADNRSVRFASQKAAQQLMDYANRYFSGAETQNRRELKRRLVQAGFLDPRAAAFFFMARIVAGLGSALAIFLLLPMVLADSENGVW